MEEKGESGYTFYCSSEFVKQTIAKLLGTPDEPPNDSTSGAGIMKLFNSRYVDGFDVDRIVMALENEIGLSLNSAIPFPIPEPSRFFWFPRKAKARSPGN